MRRADRLFRLVQLLRRSRLVTAQRIASELEVSERTVYRDVRDLTLSGVPIRGEAGVGYALAHGFDLPPLTFNEEEIEALVLGARVVQGYADPALARAADSVLAKVEMVLPEALRSRVASTQIIAPTMHPGRRAGQLGTVREALRSKKRLLLQYRDEKGDETKRAVRPLAVAFWGKIWTLAAWCELRKDFRSFRLDRMATAQLGAPFPEEPGKSLDDFMKWVTAQDATRGSSRSPAESPGAADARASTHPRRNR
jgi:predicted DNA-binding transcriptional regulator YafY